MGLIYGPGDVSWFFQILFHYFVIKETCDFWLFADPQFLCCLIPKILKISLWSAVCDLEGGNAVLCLNIKDQTIGTLISFPSDCSWSCTSQAGVFVPTFNFQMQIKDGETLVTAASCRCWSYLHPILTHVVHRIILKGLSHFSWLSSDSVSQYWRLQKGTCVSEEDTVTARPNRVLPSGTCLTES